VLQEELLRLWSASRKTVVFITHSIDEAIKLADRVVVVSFRPGRIKEIVPIDLPRPRFDVDLKTLPEYGELHDHIWQLVKDEAMSASRGK
jgi:NitT/TauT family transport system ATP-binding protein